LTANEVAIPKDDVTSAYRIHAAETPDPLERAVVDADQSLKSREEQMGRCAKRTAEADQP
jgi:hypothetical protein